MSRKTLIISEPLKSEKVVFSQKIADEALARGWQVFECEKEDIFSEDGKVFCNAREYPGGNNLRAAVADFDCIHFRPHPPMDMGYITALHLLKLVEDQVPIYNKPSTILNFPEKIFPHILGDYSPPTLISQDKNEILEFAREHDQIVVKPLYGYGGFDIKKLSAKEVEQEDFEGIYIFQKFLEEVREGTVRVNMVAGEVYAYLVKLPEEGSIESNFFRGGLKETKLTSKQIQVCDKLKEYDILYAGADFIGDYLLEVNITCASAMSVEELFGLKTEQKIWDVIENKC